ncbi:MAG: folylpolyglutamate synthase/dihydrofolate synthase family protein [candidate division WOR-3 bacterium]
MNYPEAIQYLSSLIDRERKNIKYEKDLERFKESLEIFKNPQKRLKGFLIGGTNGKGTTAHIIESICRKAGYKTGLFTSPHLVSYRERIRINGEPISKRKFTSLIEEIKNKKGINFSVFETLTTMAFLFFEREKVNYSIFEVGLGGRLDATNVFEPNVSIITSIGFDHTQILGETLSEIAREKAKILREDRINISGPQKEEVMQILKEEVKGNIEFIEDVRITNLDENGMFFKLAHEEFKTNLIGVKQALNASLGITACRKMGINLKKEEINEALLNLQIPGRFQIINRNPFIILDGAHNPDSIKALKETIEKVFARKVVLLFSCLSDKNIKGMLTEIKPVIKRFYPTEISHPRRTTLEEIKRIAHELEIEVANNTEGLPKKDLEKAVKEASPKEIIIVTGSFYLLGEILGKEK